jgi:hypothetical protein
LPKAKTRPYYLTEKEAHAIITASEKLIGYIGPKHPLWTAASRLDEQSAAQDRSYEEKVELVTDAIWDRMSPDWRIAKGDVKELAEIIIAGVLGIY